MKPVRVSLGERTYEIRFGSLDHQLASAIKKLPSPPNRLLVVTSKAVAQAGHAAAVLRGLRRAGYAPTAVVLPNGEAHKNLKSIDFLYRAGVKAGLDRRSAVLALGGGVITDMAGFFAATYMRGVGFISVPTTLLGMVDAAIGGKTGIDLAEGKNLVGAFWQPRLVWIDLAVLKTLPSREWTTGFGEILKYGVIKDAAFFDWLERTIAKRRDVQRWSTSDIARAVRTSIAIKAKVVSGDERETPLGGGREILNFGHTAGHALEAATGYKRLSHGEAISIGMVLAGGIARQRNLWSAADQQRMIRLLSAYGLPVRFPSLTASQKTRFWSALLKDKKHVSGQLRFVLPLKIGRVTVQSGVSRDEIEKSILRALNSHVHR